MRALRFTLALVVAVLAGVAGASAVVGTTGQDTPAGSAAVQPDGGGASIAATAADPAGGGRRWAVRVYHSEAGLTCPEPGRTVDGDFGRVDADGSFVGLSVQAAGSCIDLTKAPYSLGVAHFPANGERGGRAVVFGVVAPAVQAVTVTTPDRRPRDLTLANGAFALAIPGDDAGGTVVEVTLADGRTETHTLLPSTPITDAATVEELHR